MNTQSSGCWLWIGVLLLLEHCASAQDLFVADSNSGNIYDFTPSGERSTFDTGLVLPFGLGFDPAGNLYVANYGNPLSGSYIYKYSASGIRSTFASDFVGAPIGLAINKTGSVFESDNRGNIYELNPDGTKSVVAAGLSTPRALAFNSAGDLFVAAGSIYEFSTNGVNSVFAAGLHAPFGLAFDSAGNLFEADYGSGSINEFTPDGVESTFVSGLNSPSGLVFDSAGNLFVASELSGVIYKITPGGMESTFATGLNGPFALAMPPVPEPSALGLLTLGILAVGVCRLGKSAF